MKTTDWSAVVASAPINRSAARDMAYSYAPDTGDPAPHLARVTRQVPSHDPNFRDYTGFRKGRLICVGYAGTGSDQKARWVVRCQCGRYEYRKTKAFRPDCPNDRCQNCENLKRREARARRTAP